MADDGGRINVRAIVLLVALAAVFILGTSTEWGEDRLADLLGYQTGQEAERKQLEAACDDGDAWSCNELGILIWNIWGKQTVPNYLVKPRFEQACEGNIEQGCINLAEQIRLEPNEPGALQQARDVLVDACAKDMFLACGRLGNMLALGVSVVEAPAIPLDPDPSAALTYWRKACDGNVADACSALGQKMLADGAEGVALYTAQSFLQKACNSGHADGCATLMEVLGDDARPEATEAGRRACELGRLDMCNQTAELLMTSGSEESFLGGIDILLDTCRQGFLGSCYLLSDQLRARPAALAPDGPYETAARVLLSTTCGKNQETSCRKGVSIKRVLSSPSVVDDDNFVYLLLRCAGGTGEQFSCNAMEEMLRVACGNDDVVACNELGVLLTTWLPDPERYAEARNAYETACRGYYGRACANLSELHSLGQGGAASNEVARQWRLEGCSLGYGANCPDSIPQHHSAGTTDPSQLLGQTAPELDVREWLGPHVGRLSTLRGKTVVVVFWAPWCSHCRNALPDLQAQYERQRAPDFEMLLITRHTHNQTTQDVRDSMATHGLTMPVAVDSGEGHRLYGVTGIPTATLIDKEGTVRFQGHPVRLTDTVIAEHR